MNSKFGKIHIFKEGVPITEVKERGNLRFEKRDHINVISARAPSFIDGIDNYFAKIPEAEIRQNPEKLANEIVKNLGERGLKSDITLALDFNVPPYYGPSDASTTREYWRSPDGYLAYRIDNENDKKIIEEIIYNTIEKSKDKE